MVVKEIFPSLKQKPNGEFETAWFLHSKKRVAYLMSNNLL
jgi:hypothetical protein